MWLFYYLNCEKNYEILNSKSPCTLLNKIMNFNKNGTDSKMENPKHSFRETNLVLQLIEELHIKSKTVMSWSSWKKKEGIFCTIYFVQRNFFNICVLSKFMVYWIHFHNVHIFTHQKALLHTLLLLVFKIVESSQCILNPLIHNVPKRSDTL